MDDVRQLGECLRYEPSGRDMADFRDTDILAKLTVFGRGMNLRDDLARVVEAEIIPKLMLAHRQDATPQFCNILPNADQVEAFTDLMLAPAGDDLDTRIAELLESGLSPDSLLLDLLAPTARHLGILWEEDLCDFVEVTRAMGRLQRVMHEIGRRFDAPRVPRHGRRILLLPCPGDSHSFGLTVVERFFHEAGWTVTSTAAQPNGDVLKRVRDAWFDIIGLSLACEHLIPRLAETVTALRRNSRNAAVRIMVGGPAILANPVYSKQVGADASAGDARDALSIAESLLDLPARPC